jgi:hypothetical protein
MSANLLDYAAMGMDAYSAVGEANAGKTAALYSASIARTNAALARQQGAAEATRIFKEGREFVGTQRAVASGSGARVDSGSTADVLQDTMTRVDFDASMARYNAELEAIGFESKARMAKMEADQYSPLMAFGTSLLTSATYLQKKYQKLGSYESTIEK